MALKYQRILLKISGEALGGEKGMGFDEPTMDAICGGVKKAHDLGVQIGIGNITCITITVICLARILIILMK